MDDHIQQAADWLRDNVTFFQHYGPEATDVAQALADAGLLVTAEQRAVLDAAEAWARNPSSRIFGCTPEARLRSALDALRAATPKDGER